MASFDGVNYSLRPSKGIQRQLVINGVRLLQEKLNLERLVYVGLGSIWFTDFVLAHKILRIDDMISIEGDPVGYRRALFNAPYATVRVVFWFSDKMRRESRRRGEIPPYGRGFLRHGDLSIR